MRAVTLILTALLLAACGNKPRQPDWLINADSAQDRYERAFLSGNERVATVEFARLRTELTSTGQPGLVARGELTRCAMRVATLDLGPCDGFEALRHDAPAAERAYADFLAGRLAPEDARLLPEHYRPVAAAATGTGAQLQAMKDPVSRVIAAGVLLRSGRADPQVLEVATETASQQGWRRAVLAWLGAQALRAEQAGAADEAARLRRRMALAADGR